MYKLLVVDDEFNIRDGIVNAVPWEACGVVVCGEAENGLEALKRVAEVMPDIVISDISMDDMGGLEFVERLKATNPEVKVIILSGYDEFDYAKKALELKVSSYMLKPVSPDELITEVKKLISEIEDQKKLSTLITRLRSEILINREVYLDRLLHDLAEGVFQEKSTFIERLSILEISMECKSHCCIILSLDGYREWAELLGNRETRMLVQRIDRLMYDMLAETFGIWSYLDNNGQVVAIIGGDAPDGTLPVLESYADSLKNTIKQFLNVTCTLAIGGWYSSIIDVSKSYSEAEKALSYRIVTGPDSVIRIDDVLTTHSNVFRYPQEKESAILNILQDADEYKIRKYLSVFFADIPSASYTHDQLKIVVMRLFSSMAGKYLDLGVDINRIHEKKLLDPYRIMDRFDSIESIYNWLLNLMSSCAAELRIKRKNNIKSVVEKVRSFLDDNFSNPELSLQVIADHVFLSPVYLSKLYKNETGENYLEYLTNLRIEKAKSYLKSTNIRASEIGAMVGYPNSQYFSTLFRKSTGMTPTEYREA